MNNVISRELIESGFEIFAENLCAGYPENAFVPSEGFEKKMKKLIKADNSVYHRITLTRARKALAAAVVIAALLAASLSVTAIREKLFSFFITRGSQVDVIEYSSEPEKSYPDTVERVFVPSYIVEGFELEDSGKDEKSSYLLYSDGASFISIEQFVKSEYKSASDGEYRLEKKENIGNTDFIVRTSDDGATVLVWEKDGYVFELVGFSDENALIKTALSVS